MKERSGIAGRASTVMATPTHSSHTWSTLVRLMTSPEARAMAAAAIMLPGDPAGEVAEDQRQRRVERVPALGEVEGDAHHVADQVLQHSEGEESGASE